MRTKRGDEGRDSMRQMQQPEVGSAAYAGTRPFGRAVVAGGTGFLGLAVVHALAAKGVPAAVIVRPDSPRAAALQALPNVKLIWADLTQTEAWAAQIGTADSFFDFAWRGVDATERGDVALQQKNADTALAVLRAAADIGCTRFLFAGTQAEYGPVSGPMEETQLCCPMQAYGTAKLRVYREAAPLAHRLGMEYLHLRIFSVYGPGEHASAMIPQCLRTLLAGGVMELSACTQLWNYLYIDDAARLFCSLMQAPLQGYDLVNAAGPDTRVLREFTEVLLQAAGRGTLRYAPQGAVPLLSLQPELSRLQTLVKLAPTISFEEGVRRLTKLYAACGTEKGDP